MVFSAQIHLLRRLTVPQVGSVSSVINKTVVTKKRPTSQGGMLGVTLIFDISRKGHLLLFREICKAIKSKQKQEQNPVWRFGTMCRPHMCEAISWI